MNGTRTPYHTDCIDHDTGIADFSNEIFACMVLEGLYTCGRNNERLSRYVNETIFDIEYGNHIKFEISKSDRLVFDSIMANADKIKDYQNISYSDMRLIINQIRSMAKFSIKLPELKHGDLPLFEILSTLKVNTKPQLRKSFLINAKPTNISDAIQNHVCLGWDIDSLPVVTSFTARTEYFILKKASTIFNLREIKKFSDLSDGYEKLTIKADFDSDKYLSVTDSLYSEHRSNELIHFFYMLCDSVESVGIKNLSNTEFDLFTLSYYVIARIFEVESFTDILSRCYSIKVKKHIISQLGISDPTLNRLYDDNINRNLFNKTLSSFIRLITDSEADDSVNSHPASDWHINSKLSLTYERASFELLEMLSNDDILESLYSSISSSNPLSNLDIQEITDFIESNLSPTKKGSQKEQLSELTNLLTFIATTIIDNPKVLLKSSKSVLMLSEQIGKIASSEETEQINSEIKSLTSKSTELIHQGDIASAKLSLDDISELIDKRHSYLSSEISEALQQSIKIRDIISSELKQHAPIQEQAAGDSETLVHDHSDNEELHILQLEYDELKQNYEKLQTAHYTLESKHLGVMNKVGLDGAGYSDDLKQILFGNPSIKNVANEIGGQFPHVVFSDEMPKLLDACVYSYPEKLFKYLFLLAGEYYAAIKSGSPDFEAKNIIGNVYRANESNTTMQDRKLRKLREFTIGGQKKTFEKHLTIGDQINPTRTVQVFFDIDGNELQIAYIGEHLAIS